MEEGTSSSHLKPELVQRKRSYSSASALPSQSRVSSSNLPSHVKLDLVQYMTLSGKNKRESKLRHREQGKYISFHAVT